MCRAHGCSRFVSFLPFLTIYRGPYVGLPRRRRRRSLVDGHDALPVPPFSQFQLKLASMLLYLSPGAFLAGSHGSSDGKWVANGLDFGVEGCVSEFPLPFFSLIFFLSCRFGLSMTSATPSAPLVKRGRPSYPSPFPRQSSDLIRGSSPAALSIR